MIRTISAVSLIALLTAPAMAQQIAPPTFDQLWNLRMIGVDRALAKGFTGRGFTIGIVDDIVSADHPEFKERWKGGYDIFGGPYTPTVDYHGTHVAGTAAGSHVGVARGASLVGINIFGAGEGDKAIGAGYRFGLERGVRVFNNSWGLQFIDGQTVTTGDVSRAYIESNRPGLLQAFRDVANAGAIQVFATGNSPMSQPGVLAGLPSFYPELQPTWLAVMSVGPDGRRSSYSNACGVAAPWCMAAPGGDGPEGSDDAVWSAWPGDQYESINGTSMAAPAVTGAVAVAGEIFPNATGPEIVQLLLQTATDIGAPGIDPVYGWGLLNLGNIMDTIDPMTAGSFANASWSRFSALRHTGDAMRQRMALPTAASPAPTHPGQARSPAFTASMDGGAVRFSDPIVSDIWVVPLYGRSTIASGPASRGATSDTAGALAGADVISTPGIRLGVAGGFTHTRLGTSGASDEAKSNAYHVGLYGSYDYAGWFGQGSAMAAFFKQSLMRKAISGAQGTSQTPSGRTSIGGSALEGDARVGYAFELGQGATLSPFAAFSARWQWTEAFRETGAGIFNLTGPASSQGQFAVGPGVRWASAPIPLQGATLRVEADLAYARQMGDLRHKTDVTLLGREIEGRTAEIGPDLLSVGGQLNLTSENELISGFIGYNGGFQQRAVSHGVTTGVRVNF